MFVNCLSVSSCRSVKVDCPAFIRISLSDDGHFLQVSERSDNHNHEVSKVTDMMLFYLYVTVHYVVSKWEAEG